MLNPFAHTSRERAPRNRRIVAWRGRRGAAIGLRARCARRMLGGRVQSAQQTQIATLRRDGFVVVPNFLPGDALEALRGVALAQLAARAQPLELEADCKLSRRAALARCRGRRDGAAPARCLRPRSRCSRARRGTRRCADWMARISASCAMSRAHHNCLMTKHPRYGSMTGWHRDIRYWSFARRISSRCGWLSARRESRTARCGWCRGRTAWRSTPIGSTRQDSFDVDRADNVEIMRRRGVAAARAGRCAILSLQYAALGRAKSRASGSSSRWSTPITASAMRRRRGRARRRKRKCAWAPPDQRAQCPGAMRHPPPVRTQPCGTQW